MLMRDLFAVANLLVKNMNRRKTIKIFETKTQVDPTIKSQTYYTHELWQIRCEKFAEIQESNSVES